MLTHIVLFRLKDRSPENVMRVRDRMAALDGQIPQLRTIHVSVNVIDSPNAYDLALVETFESAQALQGYQAHPVHLDLLKDVMSDFDSIASVDYND